MGFLSRLKKTLAKKQQTVKVSWLGLDHAGKTTIIRRLTEGEFDETINQRTLGMNVDEIKTGRVKMVTWDIGGQETFRDSLWMSYMEGSMGVVFVVDSADHRRFPEARRELWRYVIRNKRVTDIPILVLANKQDLEGALSAGQVARSLDLHKVFNHSYAIFPSSAATGFNLEEALEWLRQKIMAKLE
ncbi:MAG: ADP-ribosylation factor family protein [Promethearchaeota archaeon]